VLNLVEACRDATLGAMIGRSDSRDAGMVESYRESRDMALLSLLPVMRFKVQEKQRLATR